MLQPDYKQIVAEGLRGTTVQHPMTLSELVGYVDACEKLIIAYEELHESLRDLVEAGEVQQIGERYYLAPITSQQPTPFIGFSREAHRKAVDNYRERFWQTYRELRKRKP